MAPIHTAPARVAARQLLRDGGFALPTPVELIADAVATVHEAGDLPGSNDMVCVQPFDGTRPTIVLRASLRDDEARRRVVIAHALAHIALPWHAGACACRPVAERTFQLDDMWGLVESEASAFACEILAPTSWLYGMIDVDKPTSTIRRVASTTGIPVTAAAAAAAWVFPPGLVWIVTDATGYVHASGRSPGTPAQPPAAGTPIDSSDIQRLAERRDSVRIGGRGGCTLHTLHFDVPRLGHHGGHITDSSLAIAAIVADLGVPEHERSDLIGAVQGIVGGIEMTGPLMTAAEIEMELEYRFRDRASIAHVTGHATFARFVHAKSCELAARRVGW